MPDWKQLIHERLAGWDLDPRREAEIVEELAQDLEQRYAEAIARGATASEAHAEALGQLQDAEALRSGIRSAERHAQRPESQAGTTPGLPRGSNWMADFWQDVRYNLRALSKSPAFAAVAILTLAMGIGANTAIFSVVRGVLLRPLPYPDSGRLAVLTQKQGPDVFPQLAYPDFVDIRKQSPDFENLTAIFIGQYVVPRPEGPVRVNALRVTASFFPAMRVQPTVGRSFSSEEEQEGKDRVAVVSERFWREQLGGTPDALGAPVTLDGESFTVIGVMPRGFDFKMPLSSSFSIGDVDVYTPLSTSIRFTQFRTVYTFEIVGRLKPEATWEQAQSGLDTIASRLEAAYPESNTGRRYLLVPFHEQVVGSVRPALLLTLAAAGLVLLIACANLGSLLLARATARHRELAIRAALGASQSRILRQLVTESLLLATLGGGAGLLLAVWVKQILVQLPGAQIPRLDEVTVDAPVLWFAGALTLVTGLLCGIAPILSARSASLHTGLRDTGRTTAGRFAGRLRSGMVSAQVAVACVLLIGSTLLLSSLAAVLAADTGFDTRNVLSVRVSLSLNRYDTWPQVRATFRELASRVEALPGVEHVALSGSLPLSGHNTGSSLWIEGREQPAKQQQPTVRWQTVFPGYFETMGIPLLRGRDFMPADQERAVHQTIVSESLARANFPGEDPIGKRVYFGTKQEKPEWHEIIGVVGDVRHADLEETPVPRAYDLYGQHHGIAQFLTVRTALDASALIPSIRGALRELDPEAPLYSVATMESLMQQSVAPRKYLSTLVGSFAGLAFLLAMIGIHGVLAYNVERRTQEMGVRLALGAQKADLLALVLREGMILTGMGLVIGLGVSLGLGQFLRGMLFEVAPDDPRVYFAVAIVVAGIAAMACVFPARRAMAVDPIEALRRE